MVDYGMGREWADKEVDKGKGLVKRYQELAGRYERKAGEEAEQGNHAIAAHLRKLSAEATNNMHYWLGHMNAFQGVAAQLGFMEIVDEELEEEGSCP